MNGVNFKLQHSVSQYSARQNCCFFYTRKTSVLFCEEVNKKASIRRRRQILKLENYDCQGPEFPSDILRRANEIMKLVS